MANEPTVEWAGASGTKYKYWVYPRHPSVSEGFLGNYIYTKVVNKAWVPIYIGQGDLSVRCTNNHHQIECIDSKSATHVHLHLNANEAERLAEEKDLLSGHSFAYDPTGCNIKTGG